MRKIYAVWLLAAWLIAWKMPPVFAATLDFNDLEIPGIDFTYMPDYASQQFYLTSTEYPNNAFIAPMQGNGLYFGSASLINQYTSKADTILREGSNALFTLDSMQVHDIEGPVNITFFAYDANSAILGTQQFNITESSGWNTIDFDSGFSSVSSVVWQQTESFAFDNIELNTVVPEPVSCVLFCIGGLTIAAARRLRKK